MKRPTKGELIETGCKINLAIQAVWKLAPTMAEMEVLETYIREQETILPLLDPTFIVQHGFSSLTQARRRVGLLKPIIELEQKEKKEKGE